MKKITLVLILISSTAVMAVDMIEEGVVLNQELQFLQEAARTPNVRRAQPAVTNTRPTQNLEDTYFGDSLQEDSVSSKAASRRRRQTD